MAFKGEHEGERYETRKTMVVVILAKSMKNNNAQHTNRLTVLLFFATSPFPLPRWCEAGKYHKKNNIGRRRRKRNAKIVFYYCFPFKQNSRLGVSIFADLVINFTAVLIRKAVKSLLSFFSVRFLCEKEKNSLFVFQRFNLLIYCYAWLDQVEAKILDGRSKWTSPIAFDGAYKKMAEANRRKKSFSLSPNRFHLPSIFISPWYRSLQPKMCLKMWNEVCNPI